MKLPLQAANPPYLKVKPKENNLTFLLISISKYMNFFLNVLSKMNIGSV